MKYVYKQITTDIQNKINTMVELGINPKISTLYALRGEIKNNSHQLIDYKKLKDIDIAVSLLLNSIKNNDKICIVADYDSDGATSCAIAMRALKSFGANVCFFVPNRFVHGYGLSKHVVVDVIEKHNPKVILTVDNGISSMEGVKYAKENNIITIITDHHLQGETLPNADAIVNPNRKDCNFESKNLAGCGVIYYVMHALYKKLKEEQLNPPPITNLLSLVAIGTVADLVKLDLNNRNIIKIGLNLIKNKKSFYGVYSLCKVAGIKIETLNTTNISFGIAPRINAAGRLDDMTYGINCLISDNEEYVNDLANRLNSYNIERKKIENEMKEETEDILTQNITQKKFTSVAYSPTFHEGVIGIVASKVKEKLYLPTIIFADSEKNDEIKGSGRSIPEIHLRDVLELISKDKNNPIIKFGGHAMAAGLTIKKDKLELFGDLFEKSSAYFLNNTPPKQQKDIDLHISLMDVAEILENIEQEVWGQGFSPPIFSSKVEIKEQKILKDKHLKLKVCDKTMCYDAIFFNNNILLGETETIIFTIEKNYFLEKETIQLNIIGKI